MKSTRRDLLKLGAATGVVGVVGMPRSLLAQSLETGGKGYSHKTGKQLKAVPSACWGCVTRDGIIGYVEDGRLKKIEGNPKLPRTNGKLCSKGQAGVNIVYNPDRLLYPLKRVGKRGEGKWKRVSWDEALDLLINGDKYGREIREAYNRETGRVMPYGSLYVTLDRMEQQGFIKSRMGDSCHKRGGNRRKYFRITASGRRALDTLQILAAGLQGVLGHV